MAKKDMSVYLVYKSYNKEDRSVDSCMMDRNFVILDELKFADYSHFPAFCRLFDFTEVQPIPEPIQELYGNDPYSRLAVYKARPIDSGTAKADYELLKRVSLESYRSFIQDRLKTH